MQAVNIAKVLGGEKFLKTKIHNQLDLIRLTEAGVSKEALMNLARWYSFPLNMLAEYLPLSLRTLQRYPPKKIFDRNVSEHILQLARVAARGIEVFEDRDAFLEWLGRPNKSLSGKTPKKLLKSYLGSEMVLDELGRIEQGIIY